MAIMWKCIACDKHHLRGEVAAKRVGVPRSKRIAPLIVISTFAACASLSAQPYPTKPVRWISPHAAGGGTDLTTRLVAQRLSELIGQPVVVDNRIGASGNIGGEIAARAPADGYTLITITASHPANHAISERVSYDLTRDFAYISQMTTQPYVLVVHPSIAATSVKELVAVARAAHA